MKAWHIRDVNVFRTYIAVARQSYRTRLLFQSVECRHRVGARGGISRRRKKLPIVPLFLGSIERELLPPLAAAAATSSCFGVPGRSQYLFVCWVPRCAMPVALHVAAAVSAPCLPPRALPFLRPPITPSGLPTISNDDYENGETSTPFLPPSLPPFPSFPDPLWFFYTFGLGVRPRPPSF